MPQTITLLSRQVRQGTHTSASRAIPAGATGSVVIAGDIGAADLTDSRNSLKLSLEVYDDTASVWRFNVGFTWQGAAGNSVRPTIEWDISELAGRTVRLVLDIPVSMRIGATITVP